MRRPRLILADVGLCALCACGAADQPTVCTALFAYVSLTVRDRSGAPVTGLSISDTVRRTGKAFNVSQTLPLAAGTYVVFDDSYAADIRDTGDSVRVAGASGTVSFAVDLLLAVPGGCHVQKLAGPDTVAVGPPL